MILYREYLEGVKGNIFKVRRAVNKGVNLTRFERFDSIFKSELGVKEGIFQNSFPFKRYAIYISDIDYRVASFYAECLSRVMGLIQKGYSFKEVKSLFKYIVLKAKTDYIFKGKININVSDKNNVITVAVDSQDSEKVLSIGNAKELLECVVSIVSFIGCYDEKSDYSRDWLGYFLLKEVKKIEKGAKSETFVDWDNDSENSLSRFLGDAVDLGKRSIINFPNKVAL